MNRPRLTARVVDGLDQVWSLALSDADMMDQNGDEKDTYNATHDGLTYISNLTAWWRERRGARDA